MGRNIYIDYWKNKLPILLKRLENNGLKDLKDIDVEDIQNFGNRKSTSYYCNFYIKKGILSKSENYAHGRDLYSVLQEQTLFKDKLLEYNINIKINSKLKMSILFSGQPKIERFSKICWNSEGWLRPSGRQGKSKDKNSYENKYGFGHEEWIFDLDKAIDGYHYSALQSISKYLPKYQGKVFNITLFTYDSANKNWYWVGKINNVEVIDENLSRRIGKIYKQNGWLDQICKQLENVNADANQFKKWDKEGFFTIRFKPSNVELFEDGPVPFKEGKRPLHTRYTLLKSMEPPVFEDDFSLRFGDSSRKQSTAETIQRKQKEKLIEYSNIHDAIKESLFLWLNNKYPSQKIFKETSKGRNRIDILRINDSDERIFYEVKSYANLKSSIRVAIGQLFEYAFFPDKKIADKLVIVSHLKANQLVQRYIKYLNKICSVPIQYIQFDHEKNDVLQEIGF